MRNENEENDNYGNDRNNGNREDNAISKEGIEELGDSALVMNTEYSAADTDTRDNKDNAEYSIVKCQDKANLNSNNERNYDNIEKCKNEMNTNNRDNSKNEVNYNNRDNSKIEMNYDNRDNPIENPQTNMNNNTNSDINTHSIQNLHNTTNLHNTESRTNPANPDNSHNKSAIANPNKDITIKPEESKDNFGDELFEQLILNFVEKDYEEKRNQIEEALAANSGEKLYFIVHSFKTTARMLCIEDFAQECQEIQDYSSKGKEDWEKLRSLVPLFLQDFERVYQDAKAIYDKDYKPAEQEILPEFVNSPFFPKSEFSLSYLQDIPSHKNSSKSLRKDDSFGCIADSKDRSEVRDPLRSVESVGKFKPPKSRDSETVDRVFGLDETEKIFPIPKLYETRKVNTKANSKVNSKSMRSLENITSSKQFFSTQNNMPETNQFKFEDSEDKFAHNLNDNSDLQKDSDVTETPTSQVRILAGSEGGRVAPQFNVNHLISPPFVSKSSKEPKKESSANQSVSSHGQFQFSNQFASASTNAFNLPTYSTNLPSTSPLMSRRKLNVPGTKQVHSLPNEDAIFAELRPVKFDGLYKKNYSQEELVDELRKIEAFSQAREIIPGRKAVGGSRNLKTGIANDNIMTDNAYPFKQDTFKINCQIF